MIEVGEFNSHWMNYLGLEKDRLLQDWLDLVRQPSISSTGEGVEECCELIIQKMRDIGIAVTKLPVKPYPAIYGQHGDDPGKKTVLIYAHYDVQPPDPVPEWRTPPFEPTVINGIVYGRGSSDCKGPLMAHLKATEFWLKTFNELPVNLKFIFEGCEENSSKGLPEFLAEHKDMLKADLVFFSDGSRHESGVPTIALGAKGMLTVELAIKHLKTDVHSMYAPVLPNAAWELIALLNKLVTNGVVQIPGFYENVMPIPEIERGYLQRLPDVTEEVKGNFGHEVVLPPGKEYYDQLLNTPTLNLNGLFAGYIGPGMKSIVPSGATARLDMRLVANQTPQEIYDKLVRYIHDLGYHEVSVTFKGGVEPSKTPVDTPYLPLIEKVTRETFGSYIVYPGRPSTAPDYLWTNVLGLPAIQVRWGDPDSGNHAPNEHLAVESYLKGIELTARVIMGI